MILMPKIIGCWVISQVRIQNIILRGEGGSQVKKFFFFVLTYVVAQITLFPKWAHLPLNSKRLPRYGATKMSHFHAFSAFCIGKSAIFVSQNNLPFLSTFPVLSLETPFFGYKQAPGYQKILWERIFEFFIFWLFLGHFRAKKYDFSKIWPENGPKKAKK